MSKADQVSSPFLSCSLRLMPLQSRGPLIPLIDGARPLRRMAPTRGAADSLLAIRSMNAIVAESEGIGENEQCGVFVIVWESSKD